MDRDIKDILLDKKSYEKYENVLIYDVSCKPLQFRFHKRDRFIKTRNGFTCLALFDYE